MNPKIRRADQATDEILALVAEARDNLHGLTGRVLNGYGIFADISATSRRIYAAREALSRAVRLVAVTDWPTDRDYDEQANNH